MLPLPVICRLAPLGRVMAAFSVLTSCEVMVYSPISSTTDPEIVTFSFSAAFFSNTIVRPAAAANASFRSAYFFPLRIWATSFTP